jgi:hypothetical protein
MKVSVVGPAGGNARDRGETGAHDNVGRDAYRSVDEFPRFDSLGNMNRDVFVNQIIGADRLRAHARDEASEQRKASRGLEIEPKAGEESLGRRGRRLHPRFDHVYELVAELLDRRDEQLRVGAKVIVEGSARDPSGCDHVVDHRDVDSLFSENEQGAFHQLAAHARPPLSGDFGSVVVGNGRFQHFRALSGCGIRTQNIIKNDSFVIMTVMSYKCKGRIGRLFATLWPQQTSQRRGKSP